MADAVAAVDAGADALGFVFFFAPAYHPAFKHIAPVRKTLAARGQRTVFNILGPLINPGRPAHLLLGTFSAAWVPRLAQALEDNCAALFRQFAETLDGDFVETPEGGRHLTFPDNGTFKGAWRSRLTTETPTTSTRS